MITIIYITTIQVYMYLPREGKGSRALTSGLPTRQTSQTWVSFITLCSARAPHVCFLQVGLDGELAARVSGAREPDAAPAKVHVLSVLKGGGRGRASFATEPRENRKKNKQFSSNFILNHATSIYS